MTQTIPSKRSRRWGLAALALGLLAATPGCLDPLVSDDVALDTLVLPQGSDIPQIPVDSPLYAQIAMYDGVDTEIHPTAAFYDGAPSRYWSFGPASNIAVPLYQLVRRSGDGPIVLPDSYATAVDHRPIIDLVPGDAGYSPYWRLFAVPVTDAYDGEIIASVAAIEDAVEAGLVERPIALDQGLNCPVVVRDARLIRPEAAPEAPVWGYYKQWKIYYFAFGGAPLVDGTIAVSPRYTLRREGGEPLSEVTRGVDMTADGDLRDTNDILVRSVGDTGYSGLVSPVDVVITADTESIDTHADDRRAALRADTDLRRADGSFDPAVVIAAYPDDTVILNQPSEPRPEATP